MPGDIIHLCEHDAHRYVGHALLLLLWLGYGDVVHTAVCLEMTRYVIDCSISIRRHVPQKGRVVDTSRHLEEWVDERYPGLHGKSTIETDDCERVCNDVVPNALAAKAKAAEDKASLRATTQSVACTDPRAKRTSDTSTPLDTAEKKTPRASASSGIVQATIARRSARATDDGDELAAISTALGLTASHKIGAPPRGRQAASVPRAAAHAAAQPPAHEETLRALDAHTKLMKSVMQDRRKKKETPGALDADRSDHARQHEHELEARTRELEEEERKKAAREFEEKKQRAVEAATRVRTWDDVLELRDDKQEVTEVYNMIMEERDEDSCGHQCRVHNRSEHG